MDARETVVSVVAEESAEVGDIARSLARLVSSRNAPGMPKDDIVTALLDRMRERDPAIPHHGERTASYAVALGSAFNLKEQTLQELRWAALLHDLGKLSLPQSLLNKTEDLTGDEYAIIESHPRVGAEMLEPFPFLRTAAVWIAHHHERWDGRGYPYGLRGAFIPLGARILAVADTFDALTAMTSPGSIVDDDHATAIQLLQLRAGTQLDPELVRAFVVLVESRRSDNTEIIGGGRTTD